MPLKTHTQSGRLHGHSTMALSKSGPYLPRNPDAGGPTAISRASGALGVLDNHTHGDPQTAGGREDASEGMSSPQTLPDFERMRRRQEQTKNLENGNNIYGSGEMSDYFYKPESNSRNYNPQGY